MEEPWLKLGGPEVPPPPIPPDTPSPPPYDVLEEPPVSGRYIDYRISRDGEDGTEYEGLILYHANSIQ